MSLTKLTKTVVIAFAALSATIFLLNAQTGNTGGSSGGTGGGQHGEGSGPAGSVPAGGGAYFEGDPDKNPYASPTPTDITDGGKAEPSGTPKHGRGKRGSSPSPKPSR